LTASYRISAILKDRVTLKNPMNEVNILKNRFHSDSCFLRRVFSGITMNMQTLIYPLKLKIRNLEEIFHGRLLLKVLAIKRD
jgi:hypothetical protein